MRSVDLVSLVNIMTVTGDSQVLVSALIKMHVFIITCHSSSTPIRKGRVKALGITENFSAGKAVF